MNPETHCRRTTRGADRAEPRSATLLDLSSSSRSNRKLEKPYFPTFDLKTNSEMARFVGTAVEFGATTDEFVLNANARELPLIHADAYLNNLLLKYCEAALADRRGNVSQLRTRVENAISSLLPHGRVVVDDVARSLGMSKRTLARKLSDEGLNFTEILQQLRRDLAVRYLD